MAQTDRAYKIICWKEGASWPHRFLRLFSGYTENSRKTHKKITKINFIQDVLDSMSLCSRKEKALCVRPIIPT